jgi:DNA-binding NtrC family response regulator
LARKFAADFSEKYMTPPITFSPEARQLMALYRWPGNVRQLKNVVEQAAIFQAGGEVSAESLSAYLPHSSSANTLPATIRTSGRTYENERELLWQTLISMQNEIRILREKLEGTDPSISGDTAPLSHRLAHFDRPSRADYVDYENAAPSLEETERESIRQALMRNGGVRKKAAQELNISERTLYRKIKEYGLEN